MLEIDLLERLTEGGELAACRHEGFWQCMDTLRDKQGLERQWLTGTPPWKRWWAQCSRSPTIDPRVGRAVTPALCRCSTSAACR
jgi:NDP-sugar pyrophosphorylase family protein